MGSNRKHVFGNHVTTGSQGVEKGGVAFQKPMSVSRNGDALASSMIHELIGRGNYAQAFHLLRANGEGRESEHLKSVCLLRMGKYPEAIEILRSLVLNPGSTWMRDDVPVVYKTNYATALMLAGHPAGCCDVLAEINFERHPLVIRLRKSIKQWEKSLPLWQRINWRWCSIEPRNRKIEIDFEAGYVVDPGLGSSVTAR